MKCRGQACGALTRTQRHAGSKKPTGASRLAFCLAAPAHRLRRKRSENYSGMTILNHSLSPWKRFSTMVSCCHWPMNIEPFLAVYLTLGPNAKTWPRLPLATLTPFCLMDTMKKGNPLLVQTWNGKRSLLTYLLIKASLYACNFIVEIGFLKL